MSGEDGNDQSQSLPVDKGASKKKKSQVVNNDGIRGGPWTGPVRAYVPICIPWSGQGRLCAGWLVGIAPTKNIAQG